VPNTLLQDLYTGTLRNVFFFPEYDIIKGEIPYMGTSPGRVPAHIKSEQEQRPSTCLDRVTDQQSGHFVFRPQNQQCHKRSVFLVVRER